MKKYKLKQFIKNSPWSYNKHKYYTNIYVINQECTRFKTEFQNRDQNQQSIISSVIPNIPT